MGKAELPSGWKSTKLGEIGHFNKGKGISNDDKGSGNIPCLSYGEIYTTHNEYIKEFHSFISAEVAQNSYQMKKGDLLFTCSGETKEEIGKCVAFIDDFRAYAGGDIIIISPTNEINSIFMGFLLNTYYVVKQKASYGQGDSVVHISIGSIERIIIYLPPLSEQKAIAEILTTADKLIVVKERLITAKQKQKQWLMQNLLTGKRRLSGFSGEWERIKMGNITDIDVGQSPDTTDIGYYPFINAGTTPSGYLSIYNTEPDTITTPSRGQGGIGFVSYQAGRFWCGPLSYRIRSKNKDLFIRYLYYWLSNSIEHIIGMAHMSGLPALNKKELIDFYISSPPLPEQQAIANILTTADREIELLKKELEQHKQIKKYLMQKLLTGKIRVKGAG